MKIVVLIKKTPNTEAKIEPSSDGLTINQANLKFISNPYDEFAVEEAIKIASQVSGTEVVAVSFSDDAAKDLVLKALAMGADRGLIISNDGLEDLDSFATAKILAKVCQDEKADIVFCGKQGIDDDNMHVGVMVAELLGRPHVNVISKLELSGNEATCHREIEGGQTERYKVTLPAVFGASKSLNVPRYTSLPGIMKAKKKPLDKKSVDDIGLSKASLQGMAKTKILGYKNPQAKPPGKVFKGQPPEKMVQEVVKLLRQEAKVL